MEKVKQYTLIWGYPDEEFYRKSRNDKNILVPEMRPSLFGATYAVNKLKAATLISDNMLGLFFFQKAIKEVVLFYQDKDSFGLSTPAGTFTVVILAKKHNVPIRIVRGAKESPLKPKDHSAVTFLGKKITHEAVLPVIPESNFVEYKLLEL